MKVPTQVSPTTQRRLCIQGFGSCSGAQLAAYRFGIRLPYLVCAFIALIGVIFASVPILSVLLFIALLGVLLPNHPFDYVYNYGIRQMMGRPKLPRRTPQVRFACGVATFWLIVTILLFRAGWITAGTIWGLIMVAIATLVGSTDICIPSMVYNLITNRRILPKGY